MPQGVIALTEQRNGRFRKVSYEVVSEGRRIADGLGGPLTAVVIGSGVAALGDEIKAYGPDTVVVLDAPELADYRTDAYTNVLSAWLASAASDLTRWVEATSSVRSR